MSMRDTSVYEHLRTDFFERKLRGAERRLRKYKAKIAKIGLDTSINSIQDKLFELGLICEYYEDALNFSRKEEEASVSFSLDALKTIEESKEITLENEEGIPFE